MCVGSVSVMRSVGTNSRGKACSRSTEMSSAFAGSNNAHASAGTAVAVAVGRMTVDVGEGVFAVVNCT